MNSYFDDYSKPATANSTAAPATGAAVTPAASSASPTPNPAPSPTTTTTDNDNSSTIGNDAIDSDLSKLFKNGAEKSSIADKPVVDTTPPTVAPSNDDKDLSIDAGSDFSTNNTAASKIDTSGPVRLPELKLDKEPVPDPKPEKTETPTPSSNGASLSDTEIKLKSKKDELDKQISDIQVKLKKVDETLSKISDLRKQEDDILKTANEI